MRKLALFAALAFSVFAGCATLDKDADALVVRVEQTQTAANATFDMILHVDNSDRGFWRTNAPAFHKFCEFLRTPEPYGTNLVPRCVAIELNVDDLKLAYKASRSSGNSNALVSAWAVLNQLFSQSLSWSNIITSPVRP